MKFLYAPCLGGRQILEYRLVGPPLAWRSPDLAVPVLVQNDLLGLGLTSFLHQLGLMTSVLPASEVCWDKII